MHRTGVPLSLHPVQCNNLRLLIDRGKGKLYCSFELEIPFLTGICWTDCRACRASKAAQGSTPVHPASWSALQRYDLRVNNVKGVHCMNREQQIPISTDPSKHVACSHFLCGASTSWMAIASQATGWEGGSARPCEDGTHQPVIVSLVLPVHARKKGLQGKSCMSSAALCPRRKLGP